MELPVDSALFVIAGGVPSGRFVAEGFEISDAAAVETLAGEGTPFVFGDVQPTAVFGGVAELQCLTDIAAITAIQSGEVHESGMLDEFIRRGFNGNHKKPEHWLVEETLQETRGMILFQEQIMFILNRVADTDAYSFIKAACKRQWEQVATIREWFVIEAVGNSDSQRTRRMPTALR